MRRPLSGDGLMSTGFGDLKIFSGSAHQQLTKEIYTKLSAWQIALVARHPQRP